MKDAKFTVEFTTHCLAQGGRGNGVDHDRFERDSRGRLRWQHTWWYSAFQKTLGISRIKNVKPSDIKVALLVNAQTEVYKRKFSEDGYRKHEAIFPGTVVEFEAIVADSVTESALRELLERMGNYVGISPYGHNLGFGKFAVLKIEVSPGTDAHGR
jgi:hypothetical protein